MILYILDLIKDSEIILF